MGTPPRSAIRGLVKFYYSPLTKLPIQLRRNDVQAAQYRHDIAELVPDDQIRKHCKMDVARRPGSRPVRDAAAVTHDVEPQFALGRLAGRADLLHRRPPTG